ARVLANGDAEVWRELCRNELRRFRACIPSSSGGIIGSSYFRSILAVCLHAMEGNRMTSLPQTRSRTLTAQESRRRTPPVLPGAPEVTGSSAGVRTRQGLPAVDPSSVFGCVDWFQYPDQAAGRSAAEVY